LHPCALRIGRAAGRYTPSGKRKALSAGTGFGYCDYLLVLSANRGLRHVRRGDACTGAQEASAPRWGPGGCATPALPHSSRICSLVCPFKLPNRRIDESKNYWTT